MWAILIIVLATFAVLVVGHTTLESLTQFLPLIAGVSSFIPHMVIWLGVDEIWNTARRGYIRVGDLEEAIPEGEPDFDYGLRAGCRPDGSETSIPLYSAPPSTLPATEDIATLPRDKEYSTPWMALLTGPQFWILPSIRA